MESYAHISYTFLPLSDDILNLHAIYQILYQCIYILPCKLENISGYYPVICFYLILFQDLHIYAIYFLSCVRVNDESVILIIS